MKVYCTNIGRYIEAKGGQTLAELSATIGDELGFRPICAHVNNKTEDLGYPLYAPKQVEFLDRRTPSGSRLYTRSLCMMLYRAVTRILPDAKLRIEHSVCHGYFCRLVDSDSGERIEVSGELLDAILAEMRSLRDRALPYVRKEKLSRDVRELYGKQHLDAKVLLLDTTHDLYTTYYTLDGIADSYYGPLAPDTSFIDCFDLKPYADGFILFGLDKEEDKPAEMVDQKKMFQAFTDYLKFNQVIKVSNVGQLNRAVQEKRTAPLINVAEALHDKLLGRISDEIRRRNDRGGARIILLAGPSSSGKTTTCKRLAIQLMTNLMTPKMISLDDYFVDRDKTPLDADGDYDYESLYALDLARLNSDLSALLRGEEINLPTYSFELGRRVERPRPLKLEKGDVLLIEGIHGLNPDLIKDIDPDVVFKVYVSALTTLSIDSHNWISTTDNRLLRRIVRDHKYRHTSALETIRRWPSVRRGEEKWIFPYQENADAMFNSSLIFELGVMKQYAEPLLREVPHDSPLYAEAFRLLRLLQHFDAIPADQIPTTSLLREFLGGSSFHY